MRNIYAVLFCGVFLCGHFSVFAEDLTITTYYPSPYGSYEELQTSNNTYLATGGGFVGIGNTTAGEKLDVTGNIRATGMITGNVLKANNGFLGRGVVNQILTVSPNNNISTSSGSYNTMSGMSISITTTAAQSILFVMWNAGIYQAITTTAGSIVHIRALLTPGNIQIGTFMGGASGTGNTGTFHVDSMGGNGMVSVGPGTYTIALQWKTSLDGTASNSPGTGNGYGRSMTVMEIIQQP
ncbi:MAG: hypothetical protein PHC33_00790 [Candidatus Omnitrophica bacterium]|nr:hypothetical protein [Candidatus Omnitrophota bacterium]